MSTVQPTLIEAFVVDQAFTDQSKAINGVLIDESDKVGSLSTKALSYFSDPSVFRDNRQAASRDVNWTAETVPAIVIDSLVYDGFVTAINDLDRSVSVGLFKLIDRMLFRYSAGIGHATLEAEIRQDPDIAQIYVPESFELSSEIESAKVYYLSGTSITVSVPTKVKFSITIPEGQTTTTYTLTLFTSVDAWLVGYNNTTIVEVVPPLPYSQLLSASLVSSTANIFTTSAQSAVLSYNTIKPYIGTEGVSGVVEYNAVVQDDSGNTVSVPFNIFYKGRMPTLSERRNAIKAELLASGFGTEAAWKARIPGIFIAGRFYVVPLWDVTYQKPDQTLFPSIIPYSTIGEKTNKVLESLAFNDVGSLMDVFTVSYNRMTITATPDISGGVDHVKLNAVIPDFQNYPADDPNHAYMSDASREFSEKLTTVLAVAAGAATSDIYIPITENLLTFYSFVVQTYEFCVITKVSYLTAVESTQ